jgi:two-component system, NarL family, nitrate/nitrite response regulator NarL
LRSTLDSESRLHLLVIDDHAVVRLGLAGLLAELDEGCEVSEAASLPEALAALAARPDIALVLLDLHLDAGFGAAADPLRGLRELRRRHPLLPVAIVSGDPSPALASQALAEGASAWLPKSSDRRVFASALKVVLEGGSYVPPSLLPAARGAGAQGLTVRQLDVLEQLVRGLSNKEIARALGMAEPTVKSHLVTIFRLLRVRNRAEAVTAGLSLLQQVRASAPAR